LRHAIGAAVVWGAAVVVVVVVDAGAGAVLRVSTRIDVVVCGS
jgi:hypothetical protein